MREHFLLSAYRLSSAGTENILDFMSASSPMHISSSVSASPMHWNLNSLRESANFLLAVDRPERKQSREKEAVSFTLEVIIHIVSVILWEFIMI